MSLSSRLAARNNNFSTVNTQSMYSPEGAAFQEWAINSLDYKGSPAHQSIGRLVTTINNSIDKVAASDAAKAQYLSLRQQS